jgi:ABC-type cobalamin/Fe3+-siderophores transport system ATPase subunit
MAMTRDVVMRVEKISIVRDGVPVISDFDAQFVRGTITAIIGANGSGKSSLLGAMSGLLPISRGVITLNDKNLNDITIVDQSHVRSVVAQNQRYTLGFSVTEILSLGSPSTSRDLREEILEKVGSRDLADRNVLSLSGGERQRISIAHALIQNRDLILLDEPLSAQDPASAARLIEIFKELRQSGKTIIFVAHMQESDLLWCDQIVKTLAQ